MKINVMKGTLVPLDKIAGYSFNFYNLNRTNKHKNRM